MYRNLTTARRFLIVTFAAVMFIGFVSPPAARAVDFIPELDIPGQFEGPQPSDGNLFGRYVRAIYIYFIWIVGIVATAMITFAGVKWVAAAGDPGRIRDARDMISNAIIGVIIGLTSVVLLNLLSPGFTTLSIPGVDNTVKQRYYVGSLTVRLCAPSSKVECGDIMKEGTATDPNGQVQDAFCLGTICDGNSVCHINKEQIQSLTIYRPASGCINEIQAEPVGSPGQNITKHKVTSYNNQRESIISYCGLIIDSAQRGVGARCRTTSEHACYLEGATGKLQAGPSVNDDKITNMTCPPDWN